MATLAETMRLQNIEIEPFDWNGQTRFRSTVNGIGDGYENVDPGEVKEHIRLKYHNQEPE